MTQPMFFQRRPEVVQAIQWTGDNKDAILNFLKPADFIFFDIIEVGYWLVRRSGGIVEWHTPKYMERHFIQQNETL